MTLSGRFAGAWAVALAAIAAALLRRRTSRWSTLLFGLLMMALAVRFRRNVILAAPFLALDLGVRASDLGRSLARGRARTLRRAWPAAASALALGWAVVIAAGDEYLVRPGLGANPMAYPVATVRNLLAEGVGGPVYNSYSLGGYLACHAVPPMRIYQSGEADSSREPFLAAARGDLATVFAERYPLDAAIVCWLPRELPRVAAHFGEDAEGWALVAWDDVAAGYVRRTPRNSDLIARREYRWLRTADPFAPPSQAAARGLLAELARARREAPESRRVRYLTGALLAALGRPEEALAELEAAREKYRGVPRYQALVARLRGR